MDTLTTYQLQDFLLFSERTYRRLFEAQNEAWWPLPLVMLAIGLAITIVWFLKPGEGVGRIRTASFTVVAIVLLFVAVTFLSSRYAPISPIASAGYWAFMAEGLALVFVGGNAAVKGSASLARLGIGGFIGAIGLIAYPLIGTLRGDALTAAEWFGMAPDPTAIVTMAILVLGVGKRWLLGLLLVIPAVWLVFSALTLQVFGDPMAWLLFASVALAILGAFLPDRRQSAAG